MEFNDMHVKKNVFLQDPGGGSGGKRTCPQKAVFHHCFICTKIEINKSFF